MTASGRLERHLSSGSEAAYFVNDLRFFCLHRLPIARAVQEHGCSIRVIAPVTEKDRPALRHLRELGFTISTVPLSKSGAKPTEEVKTVCAVRRILSEANPRLLHNVGFKAVFHGSHAARLSRSSPAIINHVNGLGHMYAVDGVRERLSRQIMNLAFASSFRVAGPQQVIVQNPDDEELLRSRAFAPPGRLSVVLGSGVDTEKFRPGPSHAPRRPDANGPVVLFAGRLIWTKGVGRFVETARALREEFGDARWVIVGEPDEDNVGCIPRAQITEWAEEPGIEWWGWQEDMVSVYQAADVVCLPTVYREGIPKVLIEAAACEVPLVATDVPGCREIVRDGETGFLVRPGDDEALIEAVRTLIKDPDLRKDMGERARRIADEEFSQASVVDQTLDIYRTVLADG